ncbi:MAG: hemolysin family protein [Bacteroidales bacterium]
MAEIALISARKTRLESDAKRGNKSAQTALELTNQPDKFLSTIQIGITLIGIFSGLYSGEVFASDLAQAIETLPFVASGYSLLIARIAIVIAVTYFTLVWGELVPKRIGMNYAEKISKILAHPMDILSRAATPFVWLLSQSTGLTVRLLGVRKTEDNKITEEEIKAIVKEGYDVGEVQEVEQDIVERVFNLGDRDIGSIMTHRSDLVWLDITDSNEKIREKVQENLYNIYPVIAETFSKMLGVVYLKDLFGKIYSPDFSLRDLIRPVQYLPENMSVYKALEQFKDARGKYGMVTDEFGEVVGIVTLKDILEALVGQMPEAGEEQEVIERSDGSLLIDGQYSFYNFLEYFDKEDLYPDYDYNTLSGLILEILQHVPHSGEKLSWLDFEFEIVDMDGARIDKVLVRKKEAVPSS